MHQSFYKVVSAIEYGFIFILLHGPAWAGASDGYTEGQLKVIKSKSVVQRSSRSFDCIEFSYQGGPCNVLSLGILESTLHLGSPFIKEKTLSFTSLIRYNDNPITAATDIVLKKGTCRVKDSAIEFAPPNGGIYINALAFEEETKVLNTPCDPYIQELKKEAIIINQKTNDIDKKKRAVWKVCKGELKIGKDEKSISYLNFQNVKNFEPQWKEKACAAGCLAVCQYLGMKSNLPDETIDYIKSCRWRDTVDCHRFRINLGTYTLRPCLILGDYSCLESQFKGYLPFACQNIDSVTPDSHVKKWVDLKCKKEM